MTWESSGRAKRAPEAFFAAVFGRFEAVDAFGAMMLQARRRRRIARPEVGQAYRRQRRAPPQFVERILAFTFWDSLSGRAKPRRAWVGDSSQKGSVPGYGKNCGALST
jgi:hypothetical protein